MYNMMISDIYPALESLDNVQEEGNEVRSSTRPFGI